MRALVKRLAPLCYGIGAAPWPPGRALRSLPRAAKLPSNRAERLPKLLIANLIFWFVSNALFTLANLCAVYPRHVRTAQCLYREEKRQIHNHSLHAFFWICLSIRVAIATPHQQSKCSVHIFLFCKMWIEILALQVSGCQKIEYLWTQGSHRFSYFILYFIQNIQWNWSEYGYFPTNSNIGLLKKLEKNYLLNTVEFETC